MNLPWWCMSPWQIKFPFDLGCWTDPISEFLLAFVRTNRLAKLVPDCYNPRIAILSVNRRAFASSHVFPISMAYNKLNKKRFHCHHFSCPGWGRQSVLLLHCSPITRSTSCNLVLFYALKTERKIIACHWSFYATDTDEDSDGKTEQFNTPTHGFFAVIIMVLWHTFYSGWMFMSIFCPLVLKQIIWILETFWLAGRLI